ncbi:Protein farnesyltransferase/geranylgeranyltransferase type-1 subunit alpha [Schizosaccharomyces pombe]
MDPIDPELNEILDFTEYGPLTPIPQDEGENPLAKICYTTGYEQGMTYFRAIMAKKEYSLRALNLTGFLIMNNPAHYTVWAYRFQILNHTPSYIDNELEWLDEIAEDFQKNYQVWHHRQKILSLTKNYERELEFTKKMFEIDSKNYHVWSYRVWILQNFNDYSRELKLTNELLEKDIYNNSAWNHRFYVLFETSKVVSWSLEEELNYLKDKILFAPDNQSVWNYLCGVLDKSGPSKLDNLIANLRKNLPALHKPLLEFLAMYEPSSSEEIYQKLANEIDVPHAALWTWMSQRSNP